MDPDANRSFGVFKPVGHVVISFPQAEQMAQAAAALARLGLEPDAITRVSDREMVAQIDRDLERASPLAAIGQELNLVKAHRELAERGYHWLVVKVKDDDDARRVADAVRPLGAARAEHYGRFLIDDLIEPPGHQPQVAESPDRGRDAQTPSGREAEHGERVEATQRQD
jgi:hypothetical protein